MSFPRDPATAAATKAAPPRSTFAVPVTRRVPILICVFAVFGAAAVFEGGRASGSPVIHQRTVVRQTIEQQYGKPTQTVAGEQVSSALKGLTCDYYQSKATLICHP